MAEVPWLTIIGLGEDGPDGLAPASRAALAEAEIVAGAPRQLALLPDLAADRLEWPAPFSEGIPRLMALRGRRVAMLASGDPFWFGAGGTLARDLAPGEWRAFPGLSTFGLAAARLGWPLEATACLGLHARPLARLRPHLAPGARLLVLLRDGAAFAELASLLVRLGFGPSRLHVLEALGGPRERTRMTSAAAFGFDDIAHPAAAGIEVAGDGPALPRAAGLPDGAFEHDGAITKRPVRALTLSALAPCPGETLWDIGAGSGSVAIEWLLAHPATEALAIEARPDRAALIRRNSDALGVDRLRVIEGQAPEALGDLPAPDAVFVGGGLSDALVAALWNRLAPGARIVANAVTLESEALLAAWHTRAGGALLRIALSEAAPLGGKRGWRAAYPVVQWSAVR